MFERFVYVIKAVIIYSLVLHLLNRLISLNGFGFHFMYADSRQMNLAYLELSFLYICK